METTNCNLCGSDVSDLVYVERDRLLGLPGPFHLVRCRRCGLLYLNPRPSVEEIGHYYPSEYAPFSIAPQDHCSAMDRLDASWGYQKRARSLALARPWGGRLLDIGCATGNFLATVRRSGSWKVEGLDISPEAARYARERHALQVFVGEVHQANYPNACFDAVSMWNVIEHLHDPRGTLVEIRRIMKPGGLLVVGTPNLWSVDARLFGPYWLGLDAPRHLCVFSPATLRRLLQETGFRIDCVRSFGGYFPFASSLQWWLDDHLHKATPKRAISAIIHSRALRLLTQPYFAMLRFLNRTSGMTVFASRDDTKEST